MPMTREGMAMLLQGSCHCRAVTFRVESRTPYPFNCCYCSVCRKTAGGGGFAINIMGRMDTLRIRGVRNLRVYQAVIDGRTSPAQRYFCRRCGSHLWLWDPRWPLLVHPLASAIDTDLPAAPERVHLMLASKPDWCRLPDAAVSEQQFEGYPDESIEDWHGKRGLLVD